MRVYPSENGITIFNLDVTERKRAEAALRESKEKYRTLFNSMDEGFCSIEVLYDDGQPVDHQIKEANPAFEKHTGLKNARGRLASELMPGVEQSWNDLYARVIATGESEQLEQHSPAFDRWFDVEVLRVGDASLRRVGVIFRDISDRKRREANLAFLGEISQDLAHLTNIAETMDAIGAKIGEYFGLSLCLFVEINETAKIGVVNYGWHRDDVPRISGAYRIGDFVAPEFERMSRNGEAVVVRDTFALPLTDTERFAALKIGSFVTVPLVREGEWRFWLGAYRSEAHDWRNDKIELLWELTTRIWTRLERARAEEALTASEEKYRTLFESIDEGFNTIEVIFDEQDNPIDCRMLQINPAYEKMTGLPPDVVGKRLREFMPTIEERVIERYGRVALTGEPVRFEEYVSTLDGWFDVYASRVGGEGSNTVAIVFNNITDRKRHEANLAFLNEVSQDLVHLTNIEATMDALGEKIGTHFNSSLCIFSVIDEAAGTLTNPYAWHRAGVPSVLGVFCIEDYHTEEFLRASRAGETYVVRDAANDPRMNAFEYGGSPNRLVRQRAARARGRVAIQPDCLRHRAARLARRRD